MRHEAIGESLISDKPIQPGDFDPLGLATFAKAIGFFLRNEKTIPPLTLALEGDYGIGKSSMLALLRAELVAYDIPVVWLSAREYETEESLLAAVMQRIGEAIPSWWRPQGLIVHGRLIAIRIAHRRDLLILLTALVTFVSGYLAASPRGSLLATLVFWLPRWQTIHQVGIRVGLWLIAAAPVLALMISLANLLLQGRTLGGRVKRSELLQQHNFRTRLAEDFRDVVRAFRPRTLTLLIDDLHRCPPKTVVNVLDAVNFLVSSGDCFVVIAMKRDAVERNVRLHFSTLFAETGDDGSDRMKEQSNATHRAEERSADYLSRLINLQLAVPVPDVKWTWKTALASPLEEPLPTIVKWLRRLPDLQTILVFLVVFIAGTRVGRRFPLVHATQPGVTLGGMAISWLVASWFSLVAILFIFVGTYVLADRLEKYWRPSVSDPANFIRAIEIWQPLIFRFASTPGALKQFMNQLRLGLSLAGNQIPVAHAVALFALNRLHKEILKDGDIELSFTDFLEKCQDQQLGKSVSEAWAAHRQAFPDTLDSDKVQLFRSSIDRLYAN